jgi:hypothetical protein
MALLESWSQQYISAASSKDAFNTCGRDHFPSYELPADLAGWLLCMATLAESLPICFTISDAQLSGFPLVYVNSKFVDVTGYTKQDSAGRNCRFLQGPGTNAVHGQHLLTTVRAARPQLEPTVRTLERSR